MKKQKWIYVILILLCVAVFMAYRTMDRIREDTQPPKIQADGQLSVSVLDPREALLQGITATDDRDGDVSDTLIVERVIMTEEVPVAKVTYAAFDRAGNVAKAEREIVFTDYRAPRFSLKRPMVYGVNTSFDVLDAISARDDLDGNISRRIRATALSEVSIALQGIHEVKFRVTNSMGDSAEVVLPVEVYPADVYKATLTLTDYLIYLRAGDPFNPRDYLYEYKHLNDTTYLRGSFPEELTLKIDGTVDTNVPGVYAVSYTVTGEYGNSVYPAYSKLIVIVEG